ncbi:MAG: glycosyltransferase [Zetaproteobacteria bacterium]|nr:glycosyltransferase [Zetaproteobacteria bacterium]
MISIITAVHNQLEINKLFLRFLEKNTHHPYELIIIDNHSTDGSADLFEAHGATVIRNPENHCYPDSQNMGMALAKHDYFAFLNNDICVAPNWDKLAIEAMKIHGLDIASLGSWEVLEEPHQRRSFHQKWKWIRKGKRYLSGDADQLEKMVHRLHGMPFEQWCEKQYQEHYPRVYMGVCGSAVFTSRNAWDILYQHDGMQGWDVQMEGSDWDLHMRITQRAIECGDIRPPHIIPWALHHHFSRVTFRSTPEPRICDHRHMGIQEKWSEHQLAQFGPKQLQEAPSIKQQLRRILKSLRITKPGKSRETV